MMSLKLFLLAMVALFSISVYMAQLPMATFAQQEFSGSNSNSTEAVTSTNDAVLKSILIVSQVSAIGITFNYLLFQRISGKISKNHTESKEKQGNDYFYGNNQHLGRFTIIVSLSCIAIILSSTGIILLSAYELSKETTLDLLSTLSIVHSASVGQVWTIRIATSLLAMGLVVAQYILKKRAAKKKTKGDTHMENHSRKTSDSTVLIPLMVVVVVLSINLFSNSMISHSNALPFFPSLAVSLDWIHFMAVSIWIGGLFYLTTILLKGLKLSPQNHNYEKTDTGNNNGDKDEIRDSIKNTQHISILLMYFSFVAVVALTIIGITGLYLGLVHLQNINAIFNTSYGNILIIKLSLAFPLIFLGRYNQLKIQDYAKSSKNILQAKNFSNDHSNTVFMTHNEKGLNFFKVLNRSIKVESIIGISVLVAASFLSVTSPPSLSTPTADFIANGDDGNAGFSSTNTISADFSALAIALSTIILVLGIINFRKNQQNTKDVAVIS